MHKSNYDNGMSRQFNVKSDFCYDDLIVCFNGFAQLCQCFYRCFLACGDFYNSVSLSG